MGITLADVAVRAGVSEATVSRVLNNRPSVSAATREVVLTAVDELGYDPPGRMRRREDWLVGLVLPELSNPVFPEFAQAIESHLSPQRFTPVLCTHVPGGVHEDDYVKLLLDRGVAGIVFVNGVHSVADSDPQRYNDLRAQGVPIVLVNGYLDGVDAPFVSVDDAACVRLAVEHLVALGHERIGFVAGPTRYGSVQRRLNAFHLTMRARLGLSTAEIDALVETALFRVDGGSEASSGLLDAGVTAVVCGSDLMALGVAREVRRRGLRVPEDVSVVGSDGSALTEFTAPALTTVRMPVEQMSATAVQTLVAEIGGAPVPRAEIVFQPHLVVRDSTGPAPAR